MGKKDPRKMALQIAGLRASESNLPDGEKLFNDPYAELFFPEDFRKFFKNHVWLKAERAKYEKFMPGVNGAIVARIRFFDECLEKSVKKDLKQLVIIGAGYDTRALRIENVSRTVKIFEVDHPLTQEIKTGTMRKLFGQNPKNVVYVPMIFGKDRLDQNLLENGYNPELKTFFILEGLLMYIPPPSVDMLLEFISKNSGPKSKVIADFFDTSVVDGTSSLQEARALKQFVESEGASLQFGISPERAEEFFAARGFRSITLINAVSCKDKYFSGINRNRSISPMFNFVYTEVMH